MVEVIQERDSNGTMTALIVIVLILIVGVLFFMYGLPMMKQSAPQVNVPDKVDVNINQQP